MALSGESPGPQRLPTAPLPGAPAAAVSRAWDVAALLLAIDDAVQARWGAVAVRGELAGVTRAASGHVYFQLKDAQGGAASLRCAMFRRAVSLLDFQPADGQQVELSGRLNVYSPRGELQCVVEGMQRLGAGTLYELFLKLQARLAAQGLFAPEGKRSIPRHPRCLAVVTSPAGAALHDVLTALRRRAPQVAVKVFPTLVQGAQAPERIVEALTQADAEPGIDTVLLVRGGGSLEDLWAFNDERVVRAVVACRHPVVVGVGHETDVTLADLAADLRAPTPTAAAELAAPMAAELEASLARQAQALQRALQRHLEGQSLHLDRLAWVLGRPSERLSLESQALQLAAQRLARAGSHWAAQAGRREERLRARLTQALERRATAAALTLQSLALRLDALHPRHARARGFTWLERPDGRPVLQAQGLQPGETLQAQWADGMATLRVETVQAKAPPP